MSTDYYRSGGADSGGGADSAAKRLGELLAHARGQASFTQRTAARALYIDSGTLSRYETGLRLPSEAVLLKMSELYGVSVDLPKWEWLLSRAQQEAPTRHRDSGSAWGTPPFHDQQHVYNSFVRTSVEPDPTETTDAAGLVLALKKIHVWAGEPSYRDLESRAWRVRIEDLPRGVAPQRGQLSKSSLSRLLNATELPPLSRTMLFLVVCGVRNLEPWELAWQRIRLAERFGPNGGQQ
jgi:transcriptional regulator with XRE-family HTH domain